MASEFSGNRLPLAVRVFLASPGDVVDERAQALKTLDDLQYNPLLRGKITVETVAWDKPGAGTPMLANKTPQEAIAEGLPKPSECDIVIVIFWSRMGTPLPADYVKPDGSRYLSGTEWEYQDALRAAEQGDRPQVLVYRRTEEPSKKTYPSISRIGSHDCSKCTPLTYCRALPTRHSLCPSHRCGLARHSPGCGRSAWPTPRSFSDAVARPTA
jgi:hypothetical protein